MSALKMSQILLEKTIKLKSKTLLRVFVWEIAVKIPSQKIHLGNLTCNFPDDCSTYEAASVTNIRLWITFFECDYWVKERHLKLEKMGIGPRSLNRRDKT